MIESLCVMNCTRADTYHVSHTRYRDTIQNKSSSFPLRVHLLGSAGGPFNFAQVWSLQGLELVCALVTYLTSVDYQSLENRRKNGWPKMKVPFLKWSYFPHGESLGYLFKTFNLKNLKLCASFHICAVSISNLFYFYWSIQKSFRSC